MPYSDDTFDGFIENLLRQWSHRYYLDIGPGAGKYGKLIRQAVPDSYIEALEPDRSYVSEFKLMEIYDHVSIASATEIIDSNPDYHTDCVIIGDTIEHMRKSAGIDLLHYLLYRTKKIIVTFPVKYVQYTWNGHAAEAHRSAWGQEDFKALEHQWHTDGYMRLAVVDGYLGGGASFIEPLTEELLRVHRPLIVGDDRP